MEENSRDKQPFFNRIFDEPFEGKQLWKFVLVNVIIATCVVLSFCPSCLFSWDKIVGVSDDWLYSVLISMSLSGGITLIIRFSDKHLPWLEKPVLRLLFDITAVIIYSFIVSFILGTIFALWIWDYFNFDNIGWADLVESTKMPTLIALGLTLFFTCRAFLVEWKQAAIQAEQMKSERLAGQYQSLKDQLNPHFLFNSLNVLSNLVYEDQDKANAFIEKLSRVYRYVLEVQDEELVLIKQELDFARSYFELQALRFGNKFSFEINAEEDANKGLPPLTLQLLLENALKHNRATSQEPLKIEVSQDGDILVVRNNLQLRKDSAGESGIGLENIKKRYAFLSEQTIEVIESQNSFEVRVPLLNLNSKP